MLQGVLHYLMIHWEAVLISELTLLYITIISKLPYLVLYLKYLSFAVRIAFKGK